LRLPLQDPLRLPLVAGRLNQFIAIDVARIGNNQRLILILPR
jgi:hypothetical protein